MEPSTEQPKEETIFNEADFSMEGYDKHIRNARIMLFVIAGLILLVLFTLMPIDEPAKWISAGIIVLFAGVFVALGLWTRKKPYTAILTALIFFVSLQVLSGILQPASILQGWIFKIVIIVMLILGLRNGKEAQDMMNTFGKDK